MFIQIVLVLIAIVVVFTILHIVRGGNYALITKNLTYVYSGLKANRQDLTRDELLFCTACLNGNVYVRQNPEIVKKLFDISVHCSVIPLEEAMFVEFTKLVMTEYFIIDNRIVRTESEYKSSYSIVNSNHNKVVSYYRKALQANKQLNYPEEMINNFRSLYSQIK